MAYGIVHFFPGATKEQYEASVKAVHADNKLPPGQTFHAAGPTDGGWSVVAIHDSQASWEAFRDGTLMPKLQEGIKGGFEMPPEERTFEVSTLRP